MARSALVSPAPATFSSSCSSEEEQEQTRNKNVPLPSTHHLPYSQYENELEKATDPTKYNPKQSKKERAILRQKYHTLFESLEEKKNELISNTSESAHRLEQYLDRADLVNQEILTTVDSMADAKLLRLAVDIGVTRSKQFVRASAAVNQTIDPAEVARALKNFIVPPSTHLVTADAVDDDSSPLWWKLGRLAATFGCMAPVPDFLLGPIAINKKRKPVARQRREVGAEIVPELVDVKAALSGSKDPVSGSTPAGQDVTSKRVIQLSAALEAANGPVHYYRFIIDPKSFSRSVENMFHTAFLIREGQASLTIDESDHQPYIEACEEPTEEDYAQGLSKKQLIMELTMDLWRKVIDYYDIQHAYTS